MRRLFSRSARVRTLRVRTAPLVQLKRSLDYHSRRLTRRFRRYGSRVDNSRRRGVRALSARFALSTGFPSCAPLARTSAPVSGISVTRRPRDRSRSQLNKTSLLYNFRAPVMENKGLHTTVARKLQASRARPVGAPLPVQKCKVLYICLAPYHCAPNGKTLTGFPSLLRAVGAETGACAPFHSVNQKREKIFCSFAPGNDIKE